MAREDDGCDFKDVFGFLLREAAYCFGVFLNIVEDVGVSAVDLCECLAIFLLFLFGGLSLSFDAPGLRFLGCFLLGKQACLFLSPCTGFRLCLTFAQCGGLCHCFPMVDVALQCVDGCLSPLSFLDLLLE